MNLANIIIPLLDLTSLNETDTETTIKQLSLRAKTPKGSVAAVCVYSQFIKTVAKILPDNNIKIATVANFPEGSVDLDDTLITIDEAMSDGANEIDVVVPYQAYLKGDKNLVGSFIRNCKEACHKGILFKTILETWALVNTENIYNLSRLAIENGADFIKTSTGKISIGATPEAATAMLKAIKDSGRLVGFKASGGIRTVEQAMEYINLAKNIMGEAWISPAHFRIGAS